MKCKHKWQAVDIFRDKELDIDIMCWVYKGWIGVFVCHKCKKFKTEDVKRE